MDKYNHWLAKLFDFLFGQGNGYAVTIGQTAYYSVPKEQVGAFWRKHEDKHKEQWRKDGYVKFFCKYVFYMLRYGYKKNPYEIEAEAAAIKQ